MIKRNARTVRPLSARQRKRRANNVRTVAFSILATVIGLPLALILGIFMGEGLAQNTALSSAIMKAMTTETVYQLETYDAAGNAYITDYDLSESDCDGMAAAIVQNYQDATCIPTK